MRASRSDLKRRILIALDKSPSSIYDILYSLSDFSDPRRTRLPKLLKAMEGEELVRSALQPGPLGPYRRIYEPGPGADDFLKEQLRCGIETLLHFYLQYRESDTEPAYNLPKEKNCTPAEGRLLLASYPNMTVAQLEWIREIVTSSRDIEIAIIGPDHMLSKSGIDYSVAGETIDQLDAKDESFDFIQLDGVPSREILENAIPEFHRVLIPKGKLRVATSLAFFDEPQKATLEQFIRITAATLFPELGIVEGNDVISSLKKYFKKASAYETEDRRACFMATK